MISKTEVRQSLLKAILPQIISCVDNYLTERVMNYFLMNPKKTMVKINEKSKIKGNEFIDHRIQMYQGCVKEFLLENLVIDGKEA